jgi:folate-binding protein YgfZ
MVVPGGQAELTASSLSRYAIMDDFTAAPRPEMTLMALVGPGASASLAAAGVPPGELAAAPLLSHAEVRGLEHTFWLIRVRALGRDGFWIGGTPDALAALDQRLAAAAVPALAPATAEVARIAALEPKWGNEITTEYFPMEVGLSDAIDYTKGCYLGQEPIVRIRDRGHINWRLVGLDIDGAVDPSPADRLETDAKPKAGRITSAGRLPDGRGVALALLHTSVPVGSGLRIPHGDAVIGAFVRAEVI